MSSPVTREEFNRLEKSVENVLNKLETLNSTLNRLASAIELSNNNMCSVNEKIISLQDSRSKIFDTLKDHGERILVVETVGKVSKDNLARTLSVASFIIVVVGFLLRLAKVW